MEFLTRFKYHSVKLAKKLIKGAIPTSSWLFLKEKAQSFLLPRREYEALLMKEWIARQKGLPPSTSTDFIDGVNLVGFLSAANGLGEAVRSTLRGLQAAGIPYSLVDMDVDVPDRQRIPHPDPDTSTGFRYQTNLLHVNPNHFPYLWEKFGASALLGRYTIGVWYWELPTIPAHWIPGFQVLNEVWAPTRFVFDAVQACSPIPVDLIPPSIEVEYDDRLTRADFGLPEGRFLFLCAYDVLSIPARKNPEAAINAFRYAFAPDNSRVGLVVKINNAEESPNGVARLEEMLKDYTNVYFVKQVLPRKHFNALIHLVDSYVSLHRSEGFALVAAESMYLGKPVVMTNWSGNTDFMTTENCCAVDCTLVPVGENAGPYDANQLWAEPDIQQAGVWMRLLSSDPVMVDRISQKARFTILENFSTKELAKRLREKLNKRVEQ